MSTPEKTAEPQPLIDAHQFPWPSLPQRIRCKFQVLYSIAHNEPKSMKRAAIAKWDGADVLFTSERLAWLVPCPNGQFSTFGLRRERGFLGYDIEMSKTLMPLAEAEAALVAYVLLGEVKA